MKIDKWTERLYDCLLPVGKRQLLIHILPFQSGNIRSNGEYVQQYVAFYYLIDQKNRAAEREGANGRKVELKLSEIVWSSVKCTRRFRNEKKNDFFFGWRQFNARKQKQIDNFLHERFDSFHLSCSWVYFRSTNGTLRVSCTFFPFFGFVYEVGNRIFRGESSASAECAVEKHCIVAFLFSPFRLVLLLFLRADEAKHK